MGIFRDIRTRDWNRVKSFYKFYFYVALIAILLLFLIFHVIEIGFEFQTDYRTNILFTIMNSAIWGVFWSVAGVFNKGIQRKGLRILLWIILLTVFATGFGFVDFQIRFNMFFFHPVYNTYSTSSDASGYFMFYNLPIFIGIIVMSFITAHKRKRDN